MEKACRLHGGEGPRPEREPPPPRQHLPALSGEQGCLLAKQDKHVVVKAIISFIQKINISLLSSHI